MGRQSKRENSTGNGEEGELSSGEKIGGWTLKDGGQVCHFPGDSHLGMLRYGYSKLGEIYLWQRTVRANLNRPGAKGSYRDVHWSGLEATGDTKVLGGHSQRNRTSGAGCSEEVECGRTTQRSHGEGRAGAYSAYSETEPEEFHGVWS